MEAEPASATALAAVLEQRIPGVRDQDVVMVLSGGNIDVNLLSRIIDRGLVKDGRLANLEVRLKDRPGALAALTALMAAQGANVLRLDHRRGSNGLWLTEAEVALTLEMRGQAHVEELMQALRTAGYDVRRE